MKVTVDPLNGMPRFEDDQEVVIRGRGGGIMGTPGGSAADPFITDAADGVQTIRWHSTPGGVLYDMTVDDTGHVVTTLVSAVTNFLLLETGDYLLLETGDKLLIE